MSWHGLVVLGGEECLGRLKLHAGPCRPPLNITVAAFTPLESGSLSVVKLPNIVNINPEPWSRDTFDPSTELQTDQNGDTRPRLGNTIRSVKTCVTLCTGMAD